MTQTELKQQLHILQKDYDKLFRHYKAYKCIQSRLNWMIKDLENTKTQTETALKLLTESIVLVNDLMLRQNERTD